MTTSTTSTGIHDAAAPSTAPHQPTEPDPHALAATLARRIVDNVTSVVRGRQAATELVTAAVVAGGHVLVEDLPGSGKTTMARAFAASIGGTFARIQATSDLLPSDITGSGLWDSSAMTFRFVPGPVFVNVLLVDELNRTSPRTQSAFLEAMEEGAVTVDGQRHPLPDPFVLVATQNPTEQHGAYPLPEGQLDRFAVALRLDPIALDAERAMLRDQLVSATVDQLRPVVTIDQLRAVRTTSRTTHVADAVLDYAHGLAAATRQHPEVVHGASPRACLTLLRNAQALALLRCRGYVRPEDVQEMLVPTFAHRMVTRTGSDRERAEAVLADVLRAVGVPVSP